MTSNKINAKDLKEGDLLSAAYNKFVEVIKVNVRAKTTQVFYKSTYDGYEAKYPWQFKNEETVTIK